MNDAVRTDGDWGEPLQIHVTGTCYGRVTLPRLLPAIAAGASLAFVTGLGDFVASIVLYTHRNRPISIEILSQLRDFDLGAAAAYGVLLMALVAASFVLGQRWLQSGDS